MRLDRSVRFCCAASLLLYAVANGWLAPRAIILAQETPVPRATADAVERASEDPELQKLRTDLLRREKEYDAALQELQTLTSELAALEKDHEAVEQSQDPAKITASSKRLEGVSAQRDLAQERVDLAISERRSLQALIAQQERKLALTAPASDAPSGASVPESKADNQEKKADSLPTTIVPGMTGVSGNGETATSEKKDEALSPRTAEAEAIAAKKEAAATAARLTADGIDEQRELLEENIALESKRLANSYLRHDNLAKTLVKLEEELFRELESGKDFASLSDLNQRRDETQRQLETLSDDIQSQSQRVQALQTRLLGLQQEQLLAAREVKEKEAEAEAARRNQWVATLSDFAIVALPRVGILLVLLFVTHYIVRLVGRRLIRLWSESERGTEGERRYRAQTLVSVFENAANTTIWVIGVLTILDALQVPVGTLLGGVAVVGLAVAFGAQNLIRDYFSGFMILLENQYKISDVITINNMTGTVETITLRITVLRDFEGKVYFIPNGQITSVINLTHEWSRVVLDIPVAYKEKIEKVLGVLLELSAEITRDPDFKDNFLREPELLGVERLTDSAVIIRLCFVVRPPRKDLIRREMLRRIKAKFDALAIEIPFPQQTVHLLPEPAAQGEAIRPENEPKGDSASPEYSEQA